MEEPASSVHVHALRTPGDLLHRRSRPADAASRDIPNLGPRVCIVDHEGKLIGRFGDTPAGTELGKFLAPHGLAVDRHGDIYVGEVSWTAWPQIYPGKPHPANLRSLQKFEKVE